MPNQDETHNQSADESSRGAEDTSREEEGTTSAKKPENLSRKEAEKMLSDERAAAGRKQKELTSTIQTLTADRDTFKGQVDGLTAQLKEVRDQIRAARLDGVKDNPELAKLYRSETELEDLKDNLTRKEADLTIREARLKAAQDAHEATSYENLVIGLAGKYGVKADDLKEFGVKDPDKLERLAKALGTSKPKANEGEGEGDEEEEEPDSLKGTGGSTSLSNAEANDLPMEQYAARRKKQDPSLI